MTEEFALRYAEIRRQQLNATGFDLSYRHLALASGESRPFSAQGQMWLLVAADNGVRVKSDTGQYYRQSDTLKEHLHEHTGQLQVANNAPAIAHVQFVVVTWIYKPATAPAPLQSTEKTIAPATIAPAQSVITPEKPK